MCNAQFSDGITGGVKSGEYGVVDGWYSFPECIAHYFDRSHPRPYMGGNKSEYVVAAVCGAQSTRLEKPPEDRERCQECTDKKMPPIVDLKEAPRTRYQLIDTDNRIAALEKQVAKLAGVVWEHVERDREVDGWRNVDGWRHRPKARHYFEGLEGSHPKTFCGMAYHSSWIGDGTEDERFDRCLTCLIETFKHNANEAAKGVVEALQPTIDKIVKAWESIPEEIRESLLDDLGMEETPAPWTCDYTADPNDEFVFRCPCGHVLRHATAGFPNLDIKCPECDREVIMTFVEIRSYPPLVIYTYEAMRGES